MTMHVRVVAYTEVHRIVTRTTWILLDYDGYTDIFEYHYISYSKVEAFDELVEWIYPSFEYIYY